ncbi:hypothetical protein MRB53_040114 [Persea americana]|nr:hypothetical protein MRB53_040114 [Persea americana]
MKAREARSRFAVFALCETKSRRRCASVVSSLATSSQMRRGREVDVDGKVERDDVSVPRAERDPTKVSYWLARRRLAAAAYGCAFQGATIDLLCYAGTYYLMFFDLLKSMVRRDN